MVWQRFTLWYKIDGMMVTEYTWHTCCVQCPISIWSQSPTLISGSVTKWLLWCGVWIDSFGGKYKIRTCLIHASFADAFPTKVGIGASLALQSASGVEESIVVSNCKMGEATWVGKFCLYPQISWYNGNKVSKHQIVPAQSELEALWKF